MPSTSKKQHGFMEAVAHNPAFAKKVGVPQSVGQDFSKADKGRKFAKGGNTMAKSDSKEDMKMDKSQDKAMIKKAFKEHDAQEHKGGKGTTLKLSSGGGVSKSMPTAKSMGSMNMKTGGSVKGSFTKSADGIAQRGKTRAMQPAMKKGGKC